MSMHVSVSTSQIDVHKVTHKLSSAGSGKGKFPMERKFWHTYIVLVVSNVTISDVPVICNSLAYWVITAQSA